MVVESNINRQIQATDSTLGKPKVLALAERIALINPDCFVEPLQDFVRPENLDALVGNRNFDFVIDAIDSVRDKTALIAYCKEKAIPLVTVGSAGGQMDPTRIDICDLSQDPAGAFAGESTQTPAFTVRFYPQSEKQIRYRCRLFA